MGTKAEHIASVLENYPLFEKSDKAKIYQKLQGYRISIGVKKLLGLLDMIKQMSEKNRVLKFLNKLEDEGFIVPQI